MAENEPETGALLKRLYDAAVRAAQPEHCLPPHLPVPPDPAEGRLVIFAIGKAAAAMAAAAEDWYDANFPGTHVEGLALTRYGHARPTRHVEVLEGGHPIPDAAGEAASKRLLRMAEWTGPGDLALVLLSGGGSALTVQPMPGLTLADEILLTRALLASGKPIGDINAVRKHVSRIKGGRLAAMLHPARSVTLAISDVAGDKPTTIASGPTVPDTTSKARVMAVLDSLSPHIPADLRERIAALPETPKPGDEIFAHAQYQLVASGSASLGAAAALAREAGYEPVALGDALEGEARILAGEHAARALKARAEGKCVAIISGGEAAVTFGESDGSTTDVKGGPNQEYALALAIALGGTDGIWALAADTDGIDGGSGASNDPAGAIVTPDTLKRAKERGLDPEKMLARHDSGTFFGELGDLVRTGPSYTNVNDFRVILVGTPDPASPDSPSRNS
ncbi:MAG: glycerate kinase [Alphaproteobacteria bacterium]|nr:glycerate kinase [Alphaproteobacteria bacterium]MDX5417465.1 glycerate kinase [Alphaproteobacteria bacterium]MDX5494940.1 glycerate kinase [Alphaproteobacteria bacterium]